MKSEICNLEEEILVLEQNLRGKRASLESIRKSCQHRWTPVVYDPIVRESYTTPGDPPGTMGIDWQGPCFVPREEKARWKRECMECGLVEYTTQTKEEVKKIPVFS